MAYQSTNEDRKTQNLVKVEMGGIIVGMTMTIGGLAYFSRQVNPFITTSAYQEHEMLKDIEKEIQERRFHSVIHIDDVLSEDVRLRLEHIVHEEDKMATSLTDVFSSVHQRLDDLEQHRDVHAAYVWEESRVRYETIVFLSGMLIAAGSTYLLLRGMTINLPEEDKSIDLGSGAAHPTKL